MNKLIKPLVIIVLILIILGCGFVIITRFIKKTPDTPVIQPPPEWTKASSLLLDIDYEYKTDTFVVLEGDEYDYQLNLIARDWGIYIHRLKGFAKAFITAKPSAELYQLIGDSDLYKWQKAWNLTTSEPVYSIYTKDGSEHLRQDFSFDVTKETDIPDYFPPDLSKRIQNGEVTKIAGGTFYYISQNDIYMVHFIATYPLGDKDPILVETINRIKFDIVGASGEKDEEQNAGNAAIPGDANGNQDNTQSENDTAKERENAGNGSGSSRDNDGGNSGNGDGDVKPLPPLDGSG